MKIRLLTAIVTLPFTLYSAGPLPPELAEARSRYDTAIIAATKPVRERYIQELQQLKTRAMANKNLDLAVAIDQELKTVGVSPVPAGSRRPLVDVVPGTRWIPERPNADPKEIAFANAEQITLIESDGRTKKNIFTIERNGNTLTWKLSTGARSSPVEFSHDRSYLEFKGIKYKKAKD